MKTRERRRATIILSFGAILFLLGLAGSGPTLRGFGGGLLSPLTKPLVAVGSNLLDVTAGAGEITRLWQENRSLKERLQAQTAEIARLKDQTIENQDLRSELGLPIYRDFILASSEIIAHSPATQAITLARGTRDGLQVGMPVVKSGSLVGVVSEASRGSAQVRLLADPGSRIPASVVEDHTQGMVSGRVTSVELGLVPRDRKLTVGSTVVTSGTGETLPPGILIGTVGKPRSDGDDLFQQSQVIAPVSVAGLRRVFVIIGRRP